MSVFNQSRSYIIRILFVLAFLLMLGQLFNLQVLSSKYDIMAQENALLKKTIYPARGNVYDRNGKAIVSNFSMYDLMVIPAEARGVDTNYLCHLLEIDTAEFNRRIISAIIKNTAGRASAFRASRHCDGKRPGGGRSRRGQAANFANHVRRRHSDSQNHPG